MAAYKDEERIEYCDLCGKPIVLVGDGIAVEAENTDMEHDCPGPQDA